MQYDNEYDLDHNDCPEYENDVSDEFATDYVVETEDADYDEFPSTPDEFVGSTFDNSEQAATTDLSDLYEDYDSEESDSSVGSIDNSGYNSETAYENDESAFIEEDQSDSDVNPADEQAATRDNWCNCGDTCDCGSAQEKCQLDDYEIISDVLGSEKEIVKLYSTALCETAEENLRDIIRDNFTEAAADQYKAFSFMQSKGMYKTEQATEEKICEAKQQFSPLC